MVQKVNLSMTDDIAEEINAVSVAANAVADDLAALDESLGTASERNVGDGAGLVPDKAVLDSRLGTTGNLTPSDYLTKTEFDPASATLVWSGNATSVNMTSLSEQGPGVYLVVDNQGVTDDQGGPGHYLVYVRDETQVSFGTCLPNPAGSATDLFITSANYYSPYFFLSRYTVSQVSTTQMPITKIYKV